MKGCDTLKKPNYYLWKSDFQNDTALLQAKAKYTQLGFRVVIYQDGRKENNIHDGLKALIKNHYRSDSN